MSIKGSSHRVYWRAIHNVIFRVFRRPLLLMKCWASIENRNWYHNNVFLFLSLTLRARLSVCLLCGCIVCMPLSTRNGISHELNLTAPQIKQNDAINYAACLLLVFFSAILWSINFVDNETVLCPSFFFCIRCDPLVHFWNICDQLSCSTRNIRWQSSNERERKKNFELSVQSQCQCYSIPLNLLLAESLKIFNDLILVRANTTTESNENIIELSNHCVIRIWYAFEWCYLFAASLPNFDWILRFAINCAFFLSLFLTVFYSSSKIIY